MIFGWVIAVNLLMNILLDTHVLLWFSGEPDKLSDTARDALVDNDNRLLISTVSVWEIQIKQQLGKLQLDETLDVIISDQQKTNGMDVLPIELSHIYALQHLRNYHKDPFDRLLIAQAQIENITLMSADELIHYYNEIVEVLW